MGMYDKGVERQHNLALKLHDWLSEWVNVRHGGESEANPPNRHKSGLV
jgi:hypothetical protein